MTAPAFIIGAGPSELHALIDLHHRVSQLTGTSKAEVSVLATTEDAGHCSVVAQVHVATAGERK
jgi:hypothetical protein